MTTPYPDPYGAAPHPGPAGTPPGWPSPALAAGGSTPGWYPGPTGVVQWWDGRQWGPPAPPRTDSSTTWALFSYLGTFLAGFLVPLVILLTEGRKNRFVKHHATEALNWAITQAIVTLPLMVAYLVAFVAAFGGISTGSRGGAAAGIGIGVVAVVLIIVLFVAIGTASVVFTVLGAVKAGSGAWWRYPVCLRLVTGAASKGEVASLNAAGAR